MLMYFKMLLPHHVCQSLAPGDGRGGGIRVILQYLQKVL